jgi:hypothetical protein
MNARRTLVAGGLAAVAVAGGAAVASIAASASTAVPVVHTIRLVAHQTGTHQFTRHTAAATEVDRRQGKVVGYDILHEQFNQTSGLITGAVVLQRGLLYFRLPFSNGPVLIGKITGGADAFKGVRGTITAKPLNNAGTRTAVTIRYHY